MSRSNFARHSVIVQGTVDTFIICLAPHMQLAHYPSTTAVSKAGHCTSCPCGVKIIADFHIK